MSNTNAKFQYILSDVRIVKAVDEDEWVIMGIAAGPEPDAAGERFSIEAAEMVANQINRMPIPLTDWHAKNTVLGDPIGEVYKAWVTPDGELGIEARLEKTHPTAKYVRDKLQAGKQLGLSVGGHVKQFVDEIEKSVGKKVRTFTSLVLDEVAVTTKPWYQPSFGTVISKAIDEADEAKSVDKGDDAVDKTVTPRAVDAVGGSAVEQKPADTAAAEDNRAEQVIAEDDKTKTVLRPDESMTPQVVEKSAIDEIITALTARIDSAIDAKFATLQTAASKPEDASEQVAEKSQDSDSAPLTVEKALNEIARRLSAIEERVPEQSGPGVLVQKSDIEEFAETVSAMDPSTRLRFAFRAMHEGK